LNALSIPPNSDVRTQNCAPSSFSNTLISPFRASGYNDNLLDEASKRRARKAAAWIWDCDLDCDCDCERTGSGCS
jgi:hypothetical protein